MKHIKHSSYLDGGTMVIVTDEGTFYIDRRLSTSTPGLVTTVYPDQLDRMPQAQRATVLATPDVAKQVVALDKVIRQAWREVCARVAGRPPTQEAVNARIAEIEAANVPA